MEIPKYKTALIVTSTLASPFLRAEHFNPKVLTKQQVLLRWFLCDGAGALVVTSDPSIGRNRLRVLDTYIESVGLGLGPDMYCRVGGHRINPLDTYESGWHHLTQNFDQVARLSVELGKKAHQRMMARVTVDGQRVKYMFMNVPTRHIHDQVVDDMRRDVLNPGLQFYSKLADRGYPGACAIIHGLDGFLRETRPDKGDIMASIVAESSKWMFGGFLLEYLG